MALGSIYKTLVGVWKVEIWNSDRNEIIVGFAD